MRKRWSATGMTVPNSLMIAALVGRLELFGPPERRQHGARGVDVAKRKMRAGEHHHALERLRLAAAEGLRSPSAAAGSRDRARVRCCLRSVVARPVRTGLARRRQSRRSTRRRRPSARSPRQGCAGRATSPAGSRARRALGDVAAGRSRRARSSDFQWSILGVETRNVAVGGIGANACSPGSGVGGTG